jgi:iron(III) transport system permease protein
MIPVPPAPRRFRRTRQRAHRAPWWLVATAGAVGLLLVAPLVGVVFQAFQASPRTAHRVLTGPLLPTLFVHTIQLTAVVSTACGVLGLGAAWLVERTDLPFRRVFAVLLLLPLAVPEFVAGYAWVSLAPSIQGLWGASLVMTLGLYPLVYLPVAASLRRSDPALDEVARGLGVGPVRRFLRVTLPQVSRPLVGGMLLVGLYLLAEYGAFAILRFRTFATAIYTQYTLGFDAQAASILTLVLCLIGVILLMGESRVGRSSHPGRESGRPPARTRLGRAMPLALLALLALCALAIGVPVGSIVYWMVSRSSTTLPPASVWGTTVQSLTLGGVAAAVATALALPVAILTVRHPSTTSNGVERVAFLDRALPGVAIGLTLVTVAVHHLQPLYQTTMLLEVAYVILFFPLALVAVRAAVARVPRGLEDAARSLGASPLHVMRRITVPLVLPGLAAAATMVWLSATTELTATLLLRPTGLETLATRFWVYTTGLAYGAAAPYAAIMIGVSVLPVLLLARLARSSSASPSRRRAA